MEIKHFLDTYFIPYWSQVLVTLTVIGYLISRSFKNRDERSFKRYELFQEKKLEATLTIYTKITAYYQLALTFPKFAGSDSWKTYLQRSNEIRKEIDYEHSKLGFYLSKDEIEVFAGFVVEASLFHVLVEGKRGELLQEILDKPYSESYVTKWSLSIDKLRSRMDEISNQTQKYYKSN